MNKEQILELLKTTEARAIIADVVHAKIKIDKKLFCNMYISLVDLRMHIESQPPSKPLLWVGDKKTPVVELSTYSHVTQIVNEAKLIYDKFRSD